MQKEVLLSKKFTNNGLKIKEAISNAEQDWEDTQKYITGHKGDYRKRYIQSLKFFGAMDEKGKLTKVSELEKDLVSNNKNKLKAIREYRKQNNLTIGDINYDI